MISPHTPPGTKVIAVAAGIPDDPDFAADALQIGVIYTVHAIDSMPHSASGFGAFLVERDATHKYGLGLLRYAELPRCLTNILIAVPRVLEEQRA